MRATGGVTTGGVTFRFGGKRHVIEAVGTVADGKRALASLTGLPIMEQRWISGGKAISDLTQPLSALAEKPVMLMRCAAPVTTADSTLHLTLRDPARGRLVRDVEVSATMGVSELLKIANDKKRSTMVAAVAELRQKKVSDVVKSAKNLVACHGVAPESKLEWGVKEELQDIYSVFANEGAGLEEQKNLQDALGLDDETCDGLREIVAAGKFQLKQDVADEALF